MKSYVFLTRYGMMVFICLPLYFHDLFLFDAIFSYLLFLFAFLYCAQCTQIWVRVILLLFVLLVTTWQEEFLANVKLRPLL